MKFVKMLKSKFKNVAKCKSGIKHNLDWPNDGQTYVPRPLTVQDIEKMMFEEIIDV